MAGILSQYKHLVDFDRPSLLFSAAWIAFNPTFWNIVARQEYRTRWMTRLFGGRSQLACYFLAGTIFALGLGRDFAYERALRDQPTSAFLSQEFFKFLAGGLVATGNILVLSSTWALGITGTFLGDYFGILQEKMVTGFPFSLTNAPMYHGSTLSFLGTALFYARPAGLLLTAEVLVVYMLALRFENPFTAEIYAKRDRERKAGKKQS